jgi:hypothetical protein
VLADQVDATRGGSDTPSGRAEALVEALAGAAQQQGVDAVGVHVARLR